MIISHELKCIFIHVQKCAGTSITHALNGRLAPADIVIGSTQEGEELERNGGWRGLHKHSRAKKIREVVGEQVWNSYFKFSIARNPWDRALSTYHWWKETSYVGKDDKGNIIRGMESFKEFLMSDLMYHDNCCHYFNEPLDYVGKFEELDASFAYICGRLKLPHIKLEKRNGSNHEHYTQYYDTESINRIKDIFADDIETFDYKFNYDKHE